MNIECEKDYDVIDMNYLHGIELPDGNYIRASDIREIRHHDSAFRTVMHKQIIFEDGSQYLFSPDSQIKLKYKITRKKEVDLRILPKNLNGHFIDRLIYDPSGIVEISSDYPMEFKLTGRHIKKMYLKEIYGRSSLALELSHGNRLTLTLPFNIEYVIWSTRVI